MIFGTLNPEKIWGEGLTDLSTSRVTCSHSNFGNPKKSFSPGPENFSFIVNSVFNSLQCIRQRLCYYALYKSSIDSDICVCVLSVRCCEWWGAGVVVWSEVQTCIWPSWCHCHSLSLATVESRLVLPFWYWLTWVVPDKGPLNWCVCVYVY